MSGAWWGSFLTLAEAANDAAQPGQQPSGNELITRLVLPMLAMFGLFYFMMIRPQKREQKQRQQLLDALKKNDRVTTIGGIIGTVANISADGTEVTLKVDDNTKLRMLRSSIQTVMSASGETPADDAAK